MVVRRAAASLLLIALPLTGQAAELYRYLDRNGTLVIDRQGVPPEYAGKGYDVLNEQGRVIRKVAPALPAAELDRQARERQQAVIDGQLRKLYSNVEDVDRAKARKLTELDGLMQIKKANLEAARQLQSQLMEQAAVQQRNGQALPADLQARLDAAAADQVRLQADLQRYAELRTSTSAAFDADRARMQRLEAAQATDR
jgi:predicted GNAT family acetyltransferase